MISLLVAVRNFTIAVLLAWMGFSVSPDSDDQKESSTDAPAATFASLLAR